MTSAVTSQKLIDLAARAERAGADEQREVLIDAFQLCFPDAYEPYTGDERADRFFNMLAAGAYESAALTLVLPDTAERLTFWRLGNDGEGGNPADFKAEVLVCTSLVSRKSRNIAATPALALTAASLRTRANDTGEQA